MNEKLKKLLPKEISGGEKKKMETLVAFVVILIVTIIAINAIWNGDKKEEKNVSTYDKQLATTEIKPQELATTEEANTKDTLETNLENILSKIEGVGEVKVLISYSQSSEIIAMYNENTKDSSTQEEDSGGGTRVIKQIDTQKDIIYKEENGEKIPITQKVINPKIEGAIITAQGANDANVKNNIIQAVEAVTGIATHKIQVFEMRKNIN